MAITDTESLGFFIKEYENPNWKCLQNCKPLSFSLSLTLQLIICCQETKVLLSIEDMS